MTTNGSKCKIVHLNVGGTHYEVSRNTLERCEDSMLASLVSDHWKEGNSDEEPIFIDRNGRLFEYVLDYMRTNEVYLPSSVTREALENEFDYYGIDVDMEDVTEMYGFAYMTELIEEIEENTKEVAAIKESFALAKRFSENTEKLGKRIQSRIELGFGEELLRDCLRSRGLEVEEFVHNSKHTLVTLRPATECKEVGEVTLRQEASDE